MRITPSRVLNALTAFVLVALVVTVFRSSSSRKAVAADPASCSLPDAYLRHLEDVVHRAHEVLDSLDLRHVLCFGSLVGQVHLQAPLSFARDAEMCVLNEEFSNYDEVFIKRAFWKRGLDMVYDSAEGRYLVTEKDAAGDAAESSSGVLELIVFAVDKAIEDDGERMYHRVGWKRRLLPPDCTFSPALQCFPERLVLQPVPLKLFGSKPVSVPREDKEMLKFHYPDVWWKDVKTPNCEQ